MYTKILSCAELLAAALLCTAAAQAAIQPDPAFGSGGSVAVATAQAIYDTPPRLAQLADGRIFAASTDVRGFPSAAPVPALGPAGPGLILPGLALLAYRRLLSD